MPGHPSSDSGYEGSNMHINMARQGSNNSQTFYYDSADPYNCYASRQFCLDYRAAPSSVSGLESVGDQSFQSPMDNLANTDQNPGLGMSDPLVGLSGDNASPFDQFTIQDPQREHGMTQNSMYPPLPGSDQGLHLTAEDETRPSPFIPYQIEAIMKRARSPYRRSANNPHKRAKLSVPDTGYGSQEQSSPPLSPSPARQGMSVNTSFSQPGMPFASDEAYWQQQQQQLQQQQQQRSAQQHPPQVQCSPMLYDQDSVARPLGPARRLSQTQSNTKPSKSRNKEKKHECDFCLPGAKMFSTTNDRDRHHRTVHSYLQTGDQVWRCTVSGCTASAKLWARLDNFKQHVIRMHGENRGDEAEGMGFPYDARVHGAMEVKGNKRDTNLHSHPRQQSNAASSVARRGTTGSRTTHNPTAMRATKPARRLSNTDQVTQSMFRMGNNAFAPPSSVGDTLQSLNTSMFLNMQSSDQSPSHEHGFASPNIMPRLHLGTDNLFNTSGIHAQRVPMDRHTVAADGTFHRQQLELQWEDDVVLDDSFSTFVRADLAEMGHGVECDMMPTTLDPANLSMMNEAGRSGAGNISLNTDVPEVGHDSALNAALRTLFNSLPPEQQRNNRRHFHELARLASYQGRESGSDTKHSSKGKQADAVKALRCSKEVELPGGVRKQCDKSFAKMSELRKHENRHLKRYGCTFDNCYKRFGTKWEWKRHEHNQHCQQEMWRCQESKSRSICAHIFKSEDAMIEHLQSLHDLDVGSAQDKAKGYWLAKKWLGSYFCGFCGSINKSNGNTNLEMVKERNSHVADHFDKAWEKDDGKGFLDTWEEVEGQGQTKGTMKAEKEADSEGVVKEQPPKIDSGDEDDGFDAESDPETEARDEGSLPHMPPQQRQQRPILDTNFLQSLQDAHPNGMSNARRASSTTPVLQVTGPDGRSSTIEEYQQQNMLFQQQASSRGTTEHQYQQQRRQPQQPAKTCCCCGVMTALQHATFQCRSCQHGFCPTCMLTGSTRPDDMPIAEREPYQQIHIQQQQQGQYSDDIDDDDDDLPGQMGVEDINFDDPDWM